MSNFDESLQVNPLVYNGFQWSGCQTLLFTLKGCESGLLCLFSI